MLNRLRCWWNGHDVDFKISKTDRWWFDHVGGIEARNQTSFLCKRCKRFVRV